MLGEPRISKFGRSRATRHLTRTGNSAPSRKMLDLGKMGPQPMGHEQRAIKLRLYRRQLERDMGIRVSIIIISSAL